MGRGEGEAKGKGRKRFFFEKKNQKTSFPLVGACGAGVASGIVLSRKINSFEAGWIAALAMTVR
jgi:hypothetical protein